MSLSRSPIWMHRPGSSRSSVDCLRFSSQRMLSFFSMGTRVGLIFLLSAAVPLNLSRVQNFTAAQSQRQSGGRNGKARMHQYPAGRVHSGIASQVSFAVFDALRNPDQLRPVPLIGELGRVVKHENRTVRYRYTLARRLEMARQNVRFADPIIGEKAIRRLRVRPILANERDTLAYVARNPLKQCAKSLAKPCIPKFAPGDLSINPCC